jgi:hypothetical protein
MNSSTPSETQQSMPEETAVTSAPSFDTTAASEDTIGQAIAAMALNDLRSSSIPAEFGGGASSPPAPAADTNTSPNTTVPAAKPHHGWDEVAKAVHGVATVVSDIAPVLGPISVPAEIASAVLKEATHSSDPHPAQP